MHLKTLKHKLFQQGLGEGYSLTAYQLFMGYLTSKFD